MSLETESETVELSGFKQTYFGGQLLRDYAEPALGFPSTQSPNDAITKVLKGSTKGKWILLVVPSSIPGMGQLKANPYRGLMHAVVELWAFDRPTRILLDGFPIDDATREAWIAQWPKALPIKRWFDITEPRPFLSIHPEASVEAQRARGKLRNPNWLTQAASLKWPDLTERKVFVTPALREIAAALGHQA